MAENLVANIGIGNETVRNDFDNLPIFREMVRETDGYGNVFVRIPKHYVRKRSVDGELTVHISKEKLDGYYLPNVFWDFENEKELDYFLYGAYEASLSEDGTRLESKPGRKPLVSTNIVRFRELAEANGKGYQQNDIHAIDILRNLFFTEFATLHSQDIHPGYTSGNSESLESGFSDGVAASSGALGTGGSQGFVYRGIENPWGNVYEWVDGVNINNNQAWVAANAEDYASNVFASPYEKLSYVNHGGNGYVKEMGFDTEHPYAEFPVTVGGGASTYYADNYYQNPGQRAAQFGGFWANGSSAGLSFWNLNSSSSGVASHIGGRLLKKPL